MPQISATGVKAHLILAQIMPIAILAELFAQHSIWLFIPAMLLIPALGLYRCGSCGTRLVDPRIIGRKVPVSPGIVDRCRVRGQPMFARP